MSSSGTWGIGGVRCRIKKGWQDAGRTGDAFLWFDDNKGQRWMAVQWDGEDDPDLHKTSGLQIKELDDKNLA